MDQGLDHNDLQKTTNCIHWFYTINMIWCKDWRCTDQGLDHVDALLAHVLQTRPEVDVLLRLCFLQKDVRGDERPRPSNTSAEINS